MAKKYKEYVIFTEHWHRLIFLTEEEAREINDKDYIARVIPTHIEDFE